MSDVQKLSLTVLHTVAEFLALLPADQLDDLAGGTARLAIIAKGATEPLHLVPAARAAKPASARVEPEPTVDMSDARDRLATLMSRDDARQLLGPFNHKPQLTALARLLGMRGYSAYKKADLIVAIIEFTVGNRLNSGAIRQL